MNDTVKKYSYLAAILLMSVNCSCNPDKEINYIDPNIGGIAPLLTTVAPQVHRPHSMVRIYPVTRTGLNDRYLSDRIYGITLNMPQYRMGHKTLLMPTTGQLTFDEELSSSWYDHDLEELHPWSHKVYLQDFDITAEWTTSERAACYRFEYPENRGNANLLFKMSENGEMSIENNMVISGWESVSYAKQYFYAVIDTPFEMSGVMSGDELSHYNYVNGKNIGAWFSSEKPVGAVEIRVGISYISKEQAKANLENEIGVKNYNQIIRESKGAWKEAISRIKVSGGTEREKRIFYTSLYRTEERMVCQSEGDKYYSGFDRKVHEDSRPFYNDDWVWDTYRNLHSLGCILNPDRKSDEIESYARMYRQWGWVPQFPELAEWGGDWLQYESEDWYGEPMIGNHVASVVAEAMQKNIAGFDAETIYEGLKKNSLEGTMVPWRAGRARELDMFYNENGYFPALAPDEEEKYDYVDHGWEKRQAVSVTLEHSYDDWCLAQIAKKLGKNEDYEMFMSRSENYLNLWNPETGYFAPKNDTGDWIAPFDPQLSDGFGARSYFAEVNACVHIFHIQHDIPKLIELLGGQENFIRRLDAAYNTPTEIAKWQFMGNMPDATGLHGLIPTGNEPAFHIPWLYNYAGASWKTQHRVRQIADIWFDDRPTGLSGDEDGGALCAWYVFAAMGFYPVNPASGEYALSSPIFKRISISLLGDKVFTILAPKASKKNKYISSVRLNGAVLNRPFILHEDIMRGGTLEFDLTDKPCPDCFPDGQL